MFFFILFIFFNSMGWIKIVHSVILDVPQSVDGCAADILLYLEKITHVD